MAKKTLNTPDTRYFELVAALKVIALTPAIAQWLQAHDPKALAQVIKALGLTDGDINAIIAGPRPGGTDFDVRQDGSVFLFVAQTDEALAHVTDYVKPEDWQWLGTRSFAVDHRLAPELAAQLRDDGFSVVVR